MMLETDTRVAVLEARLAAVRGLVHDLSNALVGIHTLTEAALPETAGQPVAEDLRLILQSVLKAETTLRHLRAVHHDEARGFDLIDPPHWLRRNQAVLEALLPKGTRIEISPTSPAVAATSIRVPEVAWRDLLLCLVRRYGAPQQSRDTLALAWEERGAEGVLSLRVSRPLAESLEARSQEEDLVHSLLAATGAVAEMDDATCRIAFPLSRF